MTTHIQQELARAYAGLPHAWLCLTEEEVDKLGARIGSLGYNFRPPLPDFQPADIAAELEAIRPKRHKGLPHEV